MKHAYSLELQRQCEGLQNDLDDEMERVERLRNQIEAARAELIERYARFISHPKWAAGTAKMACPSLWEDVP